jgi:hypothetical protein
MRGTSASGTPSKVRAWLVAFAMVAGAGSLPRAQIVDRILAVVDNSIVTQSDVAAAVRLKSFDLAGAVDPVGAALERLIERRLMLAEVDRYAPPPPSEADISLRLEQVKLSFPSAEAYRSALTEVGVDEEQLRRRLRDDIRIGVYLQQRFAASVQPSDQEILTYYRAHPEQFTRAGALRPFDEAHDRAREGLVTERREGLIREWVAGLRRRANVNVLYASR